MANVIGEERRIPVEENGIKTNKKSLEKINEFRKIFLIVSLQKISNQANGLDYKGIVEEIESLAEYVKDIDITVEK